MSVFKLKLIFEYPWQTVFVGARKLSKYLKVFYKYIFNSTKFYVHEVFFKKLIFIANISGLW